MLDHARREHATGRTWDAISHDLGLCNQTLSYWRAKASSALVPVAIAGEVEAESTSRDVTVEWGPLVVRGLDVSGVAALLRRLG